MEISPPRHNWRPGHRVRVRESNAKLPGAVGQLVASFYDEQAWWVRFDPGVVRTRLHDHPNQEDFWTYQLEDYYNPRDPT